MRQSGWARIGGPALVVALWLLESGLYLFSRADQPGALRWGGELPVPVVLGISAIVAAAMLIRAQRPLLAYAIAWTFSVLAASLLVSFQPFAAMLLAVHGVARRCPGRVAAAGLAGAAVPFAIVSYNAALLIGGFSGFIIPLLLWLTLALTAWNIGRIGRLTAERAAQREQILAAEADAALQAQRLRLARELHDIVAHSLSAMVLQAAGGRAVAERPAQDGSGADPRIGESLRTIEGTGVQAMREMHRLLGLLRASDDSAALEPVAGIADIEDLLRAARAGGVSAALDVLGEPRPVDRSVEHTAYRLVQEALTNVGKHAGVGAEVTVTLAWRPDGLEVTITSKGGTPSELRNRLSSGHGLIGLEERVDLVDGEFDAGFVEDGFSVRARLPVRGTGGHSDSAGKGTR